MIIIGIEKLRLRDSSENALKYEKHVGTLELTKNIKSIIIKNKN